jgi:hypothetical protein
MSAEQSPTKPVAARVDRHTAERLEFLADSPLAEPKSVSEAAANAIERGLEATDN